MLLFKLITVFLFILGISGIENDTSSGASSLIELSTIPSDVIVLAGQNASFTCEPTGNETYIITWLKNGRIPHNHHWHPSGTQLLVSDVREHKDCSNITCFVSSEDGDQQVMSTATLTVISKLNASLTVENVTSSSVEVYYLISPLLLEVSDLIFSIRYNTTTSPTQSSQNFTIFDTDGVVQLVNLSPNTEYLLWMMAEASDGITVASEVTSFKTMLAAPRFAPALKNLTAFSSTGVMVEWFPIDATLDVVTGYLITWQRVGHRQNGTDNITDASTSGIVIGDLRKYTNYSVKIAAYNSAGVGPYSETTLVQTGPDVPETTIHNLQSTAVNSSSIALSWDILRALKINGPLRQFVINYYPSMDGPANSSEARTFEKSYTLNDLLAYTNYTITVSVFNGYSIGLDNQSVIVTTSEGIPETTIHNLQSTAVNFSSITLSWDILPALRINGPLRQFVINYYLSVDGPANSSEARTFEKSYTLNDLLAYTNYTITVSVFNGYSIGLDNQSVTVTTSEGVPSEVRNLSIIAINATTLMIQWMPPLPLNGILSHYLVTINEQQLVIIDVSHVVVSNLDYFTTYNVSVTPMTGGGYGPRKVTMVITGEGPPSLPPTMVELTSVDAFQIHVTWNPPPEKSLHGILRNFAIEWRVSGEIVSSMNLSADQNSHRLTNLKPFTEYDVRIAAVTVARGPFSDWSTSRTKEADPSPVRNLVAVAINSTAINVTWQPPINPNGDVSYLVSVQGSSVHQINTTNTSVIVTHLEIYTMYYVTVTVGNGAGENSSLYAVRTLESVPSSPINLRITQLHPTGVSITWSEPSTPNGMVVTYSVHCGHPSSPLLNTSIPHYDCRGLEPGRQYTISVTAYTKAGPGEAATVNVTTPCELPTVAMGGARTKEVNLTINRPPCYQTETQYYLVIVQQVRIIEGRVVDPSRSLTDYTLEELIESTRERDSREPPLQVGKRQADSSSSGLLPVYIAANISSLGSGFTVGDGRSYGGYRNYELQSNNSYRVAVAVGNQQNSILNYSSTVTIKTDPPITETMDQSSSGDDMLLIIIIAAAVVIAFTLVSVVLLFICCMCHGSRSSKEKEKEELGTFERAGSLRSSINSIQLDRNGSYRSSKKKKMVDPVEQRRSIIQTSELDSHPPIPVDGFLHKLSVLEECERQLFIDEFASLQETSPEFTNDVALMDYNFAKNRYNNILPYDHSRVKLSALKHVPGSDYINANYCDGHMKYRGYIATQGPLPSTVPDFWRMIWEQRSTVIVMLTRLEEGDRIKCHCYWPQEKEGAVTFGVVQVRLVESINFADYSVRTFRLSKIGHVNESTVTQFHFTSWPDHGVPSVTTTMLMFVRRVQLHCATLPEDSGPITIHCSAGVGRTGCYIIIDSALTRLKEKLSTIDIYGHVSLLRSQRPYMVQHEEQYFFTYEAVAEAIMCGNTECSVNELPNHVELLNQVTEGSSLLEKEFKRLALEKGDPHQFFSAKKPINKDKNRYVNVLPYENSRVKLDKLFGEENSDYINASYINGYFTKNLFIATQSPLTATVMDFWRMLWERRSPIVVMVMERGVERYWPVDRIRHYEHLSVEPTTERHSAEYTYREFKLTYATTDEVHIVRHFQFLGWPEVGVPSSGLPLIELMEEVNKMYLSLDTTAPITVHCKAGVAVTGVLVALRVLLDQLKVEKAVNVFQAVKVLRIQRPAMVQTMEQYRFLYDALEEYIWSELYCRHGPSPPLHSSHTKLPYYGNELHSSARTFSSTTDVHAMQHSNI